MWISVCSELNWILKETLKILPDSGNNKNKKQIIPHKLFQDPGPKTSRIRKFTFRTCFLKLHALDSGSGTTGSGLRIRNYRTQDSELRIKDLITNEWPPGGLIRHKWPPRVLIRHEWPPRVLIRHEWPPRVLIRHEWPTRGLIRHEWPPRALVKHEWPPRVLIRHEWPPRGLISHEWPPRGGFVSCNINR